MDRITGCLVGGAIGDALGAYAENLSPAAARAKFDAQPWRTGTLRVTSNTQLTLFTAEGMIRASQRFLSKGLCSIPDVTRLAYQRWLHTQGLPADLSYGQGWLVDCPELHAKRGSCATLKAALAHGPNPSSKGNGAVTRIAPVGLANANNLKEVAQDVAAISHPHREATTAAASLASILQRTVAGESLEMAIRGTAQRLNKCYHGGACCPPQTGLPTLTARQALDCAVAAVAVKYPGPPDFWRSLEVAICNGGATDAVGSITGQLIGAELGYAGLPSELLPRLELLPEIRLMARDLWVEFYRGWPELYPPN